MQRATISAMVEKLELTLSQAEKVLLVPIMGVLMVVIFIEVVFRYLRINLSWYSDVVYLLFTWSMVFSISRALRQKMHLNVDLLLRPIPSRRIRTAIEIVAFCFTCLFGLFWLIYGIKIVQLQYASNYSTVYLEIPIFIITISLPMAGFLFATTAISQAIQHLNRDK